MNETKVEQTANFYTKIFRPGKALMVSGYSI